jgi:hypothetical protein
MSAHPVSHPLLLSLLGYWQEKRGARPLPARRDIDPLEIGTALLPHLVLADLLDRGTRVRFRLVGTAVVKRLGFDPTGRYLAAEARGPWFDEFAALHRLVYAERMPIYAESRLIWGEGRRLGTQQIVLPLTQDGPDPAIALSALTFASDEAFPPSLRALADVADFEELRRQAVKPVTADMVRKAGRFVA